MSRDYRLRVPDCTIPNEIRDTFSKLIFFITNQTPSSGNTSSRPSEDIDVGQFFFDTDLGKPIWYNGSNWVDATGASV